MASAREELDNLRNDFALFGDWEDRYLYIIELGKSLPSFPEGAKTDAAKLRGCVSNVWLDGRMTDGRIFFVADSDAALVKGLLALLYKIYNGQSAKEALALDPENIVEELGFRAYLTPGRQNGFRAAIERIRALARLG